MPSDPTVKKAGENVLGTQPRYPGSLPFQDGDLDRRLFFGREKEAELLFYKILVDELVVLYSRSGLGKTSLLNAGVLQQLRERMFFPMMCRVYAPFQNGAGDRPPDPLSSTYVSMEQVSEKALKQGRLSECPFNNDTAGAQPEGKALAQDQALKCQLQESSSLWEFFKKAEFWSSDGIRLTPVLILDQFEELFTMYNREERQVFIQQLADLIRGNVPQTLQTVEGALIESPEIKVVLSMREEYLAHLAELAPQIPAIRRSEFRLTPLQREQAESAIVQPAGVGDLPLSTPTFSYAPETIQSILDFLTKPEDSPEDFEADEVDSSQLQLLCQYIEEKVRERVSPEAGEKIIVDSSLLREEELPGIIKKFFDRTIDGISAAQQSDVIDLLENGLISSSGKRLSLAQEDILNRFQVPPETLRELLEKRLLRSDFRLGAFYYELGHDTLVKPILEAQKRRQEQAERDRLEKEHQAQLVQEQERVATLKKQNRNKIIFTLATIVVSLLCFIVLASYWQNKLAGEKFLLANYQGRNALELAERYFEEGKNEFAEAKLEEAKDKFKEATDICGNFDNKQNPWKYFQRDYCRNKYESLYGLGRIYFQNFDYSKAEKHTKEAVELAEVKYLNNIKIIEEIENEIKINKSEKKSLELIKKKEELEQENDRLAKTLPNAYLLVGDAILNQNSSDSVKMNDMKNDARNWYEKVKVTDNKKEIAIKPTELQLAKKEFGLGNTYYDPKDKDATDMKRYYKAAAARKINDPKELIEWLFMMTKIYMGLNISDEVISYAGALTDKKYNKDIELPLNNNKKMAEAHFLKGNAYSEKGDLAAAIAAYSKAEEFDPNNPIVNLNWANVLLRSKDYGGAVTKYNIVVEKSKDPRLLKDAHTGRGNAYFEQRNLDQAIEDYKEAHKLDPQNATVLCSLGNVYFFKSQYPLAQKYYEKTLEAGKGESTARADSCFGLGYICFRREEISKAIQLYNEAVKNDPTNAMAYLALAEAYHRENKLQEARQNFKKAQDLARKNPIIRNNACFQKFRDNVADSLKISRP
jgi:tetratricopeptide (TPR) repeat protein